MFKKIIVVAAMVLIAISAQVGNAGTNLLQNGGFETRDFTDWTLTNGALDGYTFVVSNSGNLNNPPNSGEYEASLSTNGAVGTITSSEFFTTAGQAYAVTYWLANDGVANNDGIIANSFKALWNNIEIQANALTNIDAFGYREYQFISTASGGTSSIAFSFQNDPSVFHLDNVDVAPVPEPATMLLFGAGLTGLGFFGRRRQNVTVA